MRKCDGVEKINYHFYTYSPGPSDSLKFLKTFGKMCGLTAKKMKSQLFMTSELSCVVLAFKSLQTFKLLSLGADANT